jgi:imidazolonepropionase-like amidohydrolase
MTTKKDIATMNRFTNYELRMTICELRKISFIAIGLIFSHGFAQAETILLKNAIVHTVSAETIANGSVLIQNGKIIQAFDNKLPSRILTPDDTKEIDLNGQHLYPGLIALDTALGLSEISGVRSTRDFSEVGDYTPDVQSWIAVNPDSELIPVARANGITHIEPAPQGGIVAGQSGLVALDGWTTEQMVIKKPTGLHVYWPSMELDTRPKEKFKDKAKWKSLEDQAKERQTKLRALEDFFDEARAYEKALSVDAKKQDLEKVPAWEAMLPFVRGETPIMVHADEIRQIKAALKWAETNQFKIILIGGRDSWLLAKEIAVQNVPVIYEHIYNQPARDVDRYDVNFRAPEILRAAGVKFALGMGADAFDAGLVKNLPYTVAQAIAFGLPETDALKSITIVPSQLLGVTDRLGSIESGKEATLFLTDGNIFDIRSNVKRVWIGGKEMPLETRHTRLYEKYKNRPKAK